MDWVISKSFRTIRCTETSQYSHPFANPDSREVWKFVKRTTVYIQILSYSIIMQMTALFILPLLLSVLSSFAFSFPCGCVLGFCIHNLIFLDATPFSVRIYSMKWIRIQIYITNVFSYCFIFERITVVKTLLLSSSLDEIQRRLENNLPSHIYYLNAMWLCESFEICHGYSI